jgi:four helix bundle suffix protein
LEELLNDYQDFLRQKGLIIWEMDSKDSQAIRRLVYNRYNNYKNYKVYIGNPEQAANCMVCLINQTNNLLDQKLRWIEEQFVKEGGFRENLFKKRMEYRRSGI